MKKTFSGKVSMVIKADAAKVWKALTTPALVKKYLFGTKVTSNWKKGSPITYTGIWEGKKYKDKGIIKKILPKKHLLTTYWSGFSGLEDKPSNYQTVGYILSKVKSGTKLTIAHGNVLTKKALAHSKKNWKMVLQSMKKLLEKK